MVHLPIILKAQDHIWFDEMCFTCFITCFVCRLWFVYSSDCSKCAFQNITPTEIGYMNVIPKCLDSSSKYPIFENLPETYAAINTYLVNSPLEGKVQFLYISLMSYFNITHLPKNLNTSCSLHLSLDLCIVFRNLIYLMTVWKIGLVLDIFLLVGKD